jgi:hypothetical protein|tara:strand:+ start:579 stop:1097 length:519 start_codon:yes stop_codon:yes gene_type:complete
MIKDLKKRNIANSDVDVDNSLNEIIHEVETDNTSANTINDNKLQTEMNDMLRDRVTVRIPDNNQETQIADLTSKLQEQLLQQQILHEQLAQQRLTSSWNPMNGFFERMYKSCVIELKFMILVFILYIIFEKFNIISILKIENLRVFNSSAINQLILKSLLFTILIVIIKRNV